MSTRVKSESLTSTTRPGDVSVPKNAKPCAESITADVTQHAPKKRSRPAMRTGPEPTLTTPPVSVPKYTPPPLLGSMTADVRRSSPDGRVRLPTRVRSVGGVSSRKPAAVAVPLAAAPLRARVDVRRRARRERAGAPRRVDHGGREVILTGRQGEACPAGEDLRGVPFKVDAIRELDLDDAARVGPEVRGVRRVHRVDDGGREVILSGRQGEDAHTGEVRQLDLHDAAGGRVGPGAREAIRRVDHGGREVNLPERQGEGG